MKEKIKNNLGIIIILLLSFVIHIIILLKLGVRYNINSDDLSYIESAFDLIDIGKITMHGYISAQAMPGMTFFLAFFALILGRGRLFWLVLKLVWVFFSLLSLLGLYKIIRMYSNKIISCGCCLLLFTIDFFWMDNVILSETPYMTCFIWLIYFSIKLVNEKKWKYFWWVIGLYIVALFLRANIGIFPIFLFIYMLLNKYDYKLIIKQGLVGCALVLAVLVPWTIRNYNVFHKFIPLTYGAGNPLLLGTYQGYTFPHDEELDYVSNVEDNFSDEMKYYLNDENVDKHDTMRGYYLLIKDEQIAKYRMNYWWNTNKKGMIKDYLTYKPTLMLWGSFYWEEVYQIPYSLNIFVRKFDFVLAFSMAIIVLINKKYWKELIFIGTIYVSQILVFAYTFAYDRYGQTLYFLRFIIIGIGIQCIFDYFKKRKLEK